MRAPVVSTILGESGHTLSERDTAGATRVLDAFLQRSQICFQRREDPLELMREDGGGQTVGTVPTNIAYNTTGRTSLRANSSSSLPSSAVLLIRRNDARSCSAACSELCISD